MISPGRSPAIAHDETTVGSVAHDARGVATADRVGLEGIQLALGCGGVVPGRVHVEPDQDRAMRGEPGAPVRQVLLKVEIGGDAARRQGGEEGILVSQIQVGRDVEGQQGFRRRAVLAQDVHGSLEGGAGSLDESFRKGGQGVGFLRCHPGTAWRQLCIFG
jgi:hypothetical protein